MIHKNTIYIMQKHLLSLLIALASIIPAFAADGEPAQYKLNVQDFGELSIVDGVTVEYFCRADSAGWAVFTCMPEMASHIMFTNDNNRLTIRTDSDEKAIVGVPKIKVYSTALRKASNSGDSILTVHLDGDIAVKDFKAQQIGNGKTEIYALNCENLEAGITAGNGTIAIDGKARKAKLNNVSSGPVDAKDLDVVNMSCFVFGSGNIECNPAETLRVYGAGTGKVIYHGTPKVTMRSIGVKAIPYSDGIAYTLYRKKGR